MALHDPHPSGFRGTLRKTTHLLKTIIPRHKIAAKIQEIKASVQKINERSKRYGFQSTAQGSCRGARSISWNNDPRKDFFYLDDADVVGIESKSSNSVKYTMNI